MITRAALVGLVGVTLMWGLNWPIMKFSLRELTPLYFRAATMTAGSLVLFAFYAARGTDLRVPRAAWAPLARLAVPNILGWHLFSILGVSELASGRAAILGFTMPIWTVLLALLLLRERLTRRAVVSVACAAVAVALLVADELGAMAGRPIGIVWMQLAAVSWALGTIGMRRTTLALPTETITAWMMGGASIVVWLVAAIVEPWPSWHFSAPMWSALLWASTINYGLSQILWFGLARSLPATASGFAVMAVPLVGILSAGFITGETPRPLDLVAAAFVMVAIASALLRRPAAAASA
jgi:drug/metabolite transporter (DMT)-like permease